jgi:hypothetical protein
VLLASDGPLGSARKDRRARSVFIFACFRGHFLGVYVAVSGPFFRGVSSIFGTILWGVSSV